MIGQYWKLEETEDNTFWKVAREQGLERKLRKLNSNLEGRFALQGELMGPGIQGNQEKLLEPHFYLFDIFDLNEQVYMQADVRISQADYHGIDHVPWDGYITHTPSVEEALFLTDGPSLNDDVLREGLVFKSLTRPNVSFKAISNKWLLANGD